MVPVTGSVFLLLELSEKLECVDQMKSNIFDMRHYAYAPWTEKMIDASSGEKYAEKCDLNKYDKGPKR